MLKWRIAEYVFATFICKGDITCVKKRNAENSCTPLKKKIEEFFQSFSSVEGMAIC